jgi:mRNA interferase RelE/StbE
VSWEYKITARALKQLRKLGQEPSRKIIAYLDKHILGSQDPRRSGKRLKGELGEFWRFRVEDYRILCELRDHEWVVLVVRVGHRRDVYD